MAKSHVTMLICPQCGKSVGVVMDRRMRETFEDGVPVVDDKPCDECRKELESFAKIVAEGGIYFKCEKCNRDGVIRLTDSSREFVEDVRHSIFGDDPEWKTKPCGVEFTACNQHGEMVM